METQDEGNVVRVEGRGAGMVAVGAEVILGRGVSREKRNN